MPESPEHSVNEWLQSNGELKTLIRIRADFRSIKEDPLTSSVESNLVGYVNFLIVIRSNIEGVWPEQVIVH